MAVHNTFSLNWICWTIALGSISNSWSNTCVIYWLISNKTHTFLSGFWISGSTAQNGLITSKNLTENKQTWVFMWGYVSCPQWDVALSGGRTQDTFECTMTVTKHDYHWKYSAQTFSSSCPGTLRHHHYLVFLLSGWFGRSGLKITPVVLSVVITSLSVSLNELLTS